MAACSVYKVFVGRVVSGSVRFECDLLAIVSLYVGWGSDCFFFKAEDGIRISLKSRGLGNVYKRKVLSGR